ncbi:MAG: cobyric acid synthase [Paracoccaceae bacterium]
MAKAIMIQGTGTNVGKSVIVAGLARAFVRRGKTVRPFKPQNMSNNAAVTPENGEIGRAQALQARAAGVAPHTDMNPVLLKPQSQIGSQVVVQGQVLGSYDARSYSQLKPELLATVLESFHRLSSQCDLVLVEGAGSPAEINLRAGDIANMGFATAAGVPVVLMGDIDRGGAIAQLVGTAAVLDTNDLAQIKGFTVNKFRGDASLFDDGMFQISERTQWPSLGVIPWFDAAGKLPAEDTMDIKSQPGSDYNITVPRLPGLANFDDLDPLAQEPGISVQFVEPGTALPGNADLILIPGSKTTLADLAVFRKAGWDIDLTAHIRRGGQVLGICGGYQILGKTLADPIGIEGPPETVDGLGHLDVHTVLEPLKRLAQVTGTCSASATPVQGYEIHMGRTEGPDCSRAWLTIGGEPAGAASANGKIRGCYIHGLFESDAFRREFLAQQGHRSDLNYEVQVETVLDELADHLENHMDIDQLWVLAEEIT